MRLDASFACLGGADEMALFQRVGVSSRRVAASNSGVYVYTSRTECRVRV